MPELHVRVSSDGPVQVVRFVNDMFLLDGLGQALAQSSAEFHEGLDSMMERRPADFPAADQRAYGAGTVASRK